MANGPRGGKLRKGVCADMYAEIHAQTTSHVMCPRISDNGQQGPFQHYRRARDQGRRGQRWARLTGQPRYLLDLASVEDNCQVLARGDARLRTVAIGQIRGSEGRSRYFDRDFHPLHDEARGRWLNIARARQQGKNLPPVVLVQVGDIFFVRDGHHRISVARALGQIDVEARVTVWQVAGPLPWDVQTEPSHTGLAGRLLGLGQILKRCCPQGLTGGVRSALGPAMGC
jgi:hypothetical protein